MLMSTVMASAKDGDTFTKKINSISVTFQVISEAEKTCRIKTAGVNNKNTNMEIPEEVNGYKLTEIGYNSFDGQINLSSISIPKSVKVIELRAFQGCTNLETVTFSGDGLDHIWPDAFYGCTKLKSITIPSSTTMISQEAFANCIGLTSISIPASVKNLSVSTFSGCKNLKSVRFEDGKETLHTSTTTNTSSRSIIMFKDCPIESVYIGRNISIDDAKSSPFYNNASLKEVNFGETVTDLPRGVFAQCTNLTTVRFTGMKQNGQELQVFFTPLKSISEVAFYGCASLKSIYLPLSVTKISDSAFRKCTTLNEIKLPNGLSEIGSMAFEECSSLAAVTIPSSVRTIGTAAFRRTALESVILPNKIAEIANDIFYECKELKEISIPASVRKIGSGAFEHCSELQFVIFDKNEWVLQIGEGAFYGCTKLSAIVLPQRLASIERSLFGNCTSLTSVTIGNMVTNIGSSVFLNCTSLTSLTIGDNVTNIGDNAFAGCTNLTSLKIGDNVTSIGNNAFDGCISLSGIHIPDSLRYIGKYAFQNCTSLYSLTIPHAVTYIGTGAFLKCTGLKSLISFSNVFIDKYTIPAAPCVVLVAPSTISRYTAANVRPIVTMEATQATISVHSTNDYSISEAKLYGNTKTSTDGTVSFSNLAPNKQHLIHLSGFMPQDLEQLGITESIEGDLDFTTKPITLDIELVKATNLTLRVKGVYDTGDAMVSKTDFGDDGGGKEITIGGLAPGQSRKVNFNVTTSDGSITSMSKSFKTIPVNVSMGVQTVTPTSCTLKGSYSVIDATVTATQIDNQKGNSIKKYGLDPNTNYAFYYYVTTKEGGIVNAAIGIKTPALDLETQNAQTVSDKKAIIGAKTNGEDNGLRFGFEWRRYDAPDLVPSTFSECPLYNGIISGSLNNLSANTYYKYRPFYKSDSGRMYYGEWSAFGTADAYVYFKPEVHTYEAQNITTRSAELRGTALPGSEDVIEQGFEYWPDQSFARTTEASSGNRTVVTVSGMLMVTTIDNLESGTSYRYRSFVRTSKETTFGEEMTFQTLEVITDIYTPHVESTAEQDYWYTIDGRALNSRPKKAGIYIHNRKKVIIK